MITVGNSEGLTTLMVKNLPRNCSVLSLYRVVLSVVGHQACNLIYVPWDNSKTGNAGYSFANFVNAAEAQRAMELLGPELLKLSRVPGTPMVLVPSRICGMRESVLACTRPIKGCKGRKSRARQLIIVHEGRLIDEKTALNLYCSELSGSDPLPEAAPSPFPSSCRSSAARPGELPVPEVGRAPAPRRSQSGADAPQRERLADVLERYGVPASSQSGLPPRFLLHL